MIFSAVNLSAQGPDCDPPVIICPSPFELTFCGAGQVCVDIGIENNVPVTFTASQPFSADKGNLICFDVDTSGTYVYTIIATNECGADTCEVTALVTINEKPVITCPDPSESTICEPTLLCVSVPISDYDDVYVEGAVWENGELCFTPEEPGLYSFTVEATNGCGTSYCTVDYQVNFRTEPVIDCPLVELSETLCTPSMVCFDLPISDAAVVISSIGTWDDGQLCFFADTAGVYTLHVEASNICGSSECDILIEVTIIPEVSIDCPVEHVPLTICEAGQYCFDLPIYNADDVQVENGTWDNGTLCLDIYNEGTFGFQISASNQCHSDQCQFIVDVTLEQPVNIACPFSPLSKTICGAGLVEVELMIDNADMVTPTFGSWENGILSFQADTSGSYGITVSASNACYSDECPLAVEVTIDTPPVITWPTGPLSYTQCAPGEEICIDLPIYNAWEVITNLDAIWDNDQLCFTPQYPGSGSYNGTYQLMVIASNGCGVDTCQFMAYVTINPKPMIVCPDSPIDVTECLGSFVRIPVNYAYADEITVEGAEYENGDVKFVASESEVRHITMIATSECGADTCDFDVNLTVIKPPQPCIGIDSATQGQTPVIVYFNNCTEISGEMTFTWDFHDGSPTSDEFEPAHEYYQNGLYDITLSIANECGTANYTIFDYVLIKDAQVVIPTTEWVNIYCGEPTLNGEPLQPGDIISAYDPDGILCGMAEVKEDGSYGFMPIYRDDPNSEVDEGPEPGDLISIQINFDDVYANPPIIWGTNGDRYEVCEFSTEKCFTLALMNGWNLISWNISMIKSVEDFIADQPSGDCIDVILGFDNGGLTYDPDYPQYSTLHTMDYFHGYWVMTDCPTELTYCAGPIDPNNSIYLYQGWNLISYWPETILSVEDALTSVYSDLLVALGFDGVGLTWLPSGGRNNTLTEMAPGYGYWAKVSEGQFLIYPGFMVPGFAAKPAARPLVKDIVPTRSWVSVFGHDLTVDGQAVSAGSELDVYTSEGTLCGSAVYNGNLLKFTPVYGREANSAAYPESGDKLTVTVDGTPVYPEITWTEHGDRIELGELTTAAGKGSPSVPGTYQLAQNYPNPFNPETVISFALPEAGPVEIAVFNMLGQKVMTLVNDYYEAGTYEVNWRAVDDSGSRVSSGVYLYRLTAGDQVITKKMILTK